MYENNNKIALNGKTKIKQTEDFYFGRRKGGVL